MYRTDLHHPSAIKREEKCFSKKYGKNEGKLCHKLYKFDLCIKPTLKQEMPDDCAKRTTWDEPTSKYTLYNILVISALLDPAVD